MKITKYVVILLVVLILMGMSFFIGYQGSPDAYTQAVNALLERRIQWYQTAFDFANDKYCFEDAIFEPFPTSTLPYLP